MPLDLSNAVSYLATARGFCQFQGRNLPHERPRFLASSTGPLITRQLYGACLLTLWRIHWKDAHGSSDGFELFLYVGETPMTWQVYPLHLKRNTALRAHKLLLPSCVPSRNQLSCSKTRPIHSQAPFLSSALSVPIICRLIFQSFKPRSCPFYLAGGLFF